MQVQSTEKPVYDNLFTHLGPFHIMLARGMKVTSTVIFIDYTAIY